MIQEIKLARYLYISIYMCVCVLGLWKVVEYFVDVKKLCVFDSYLLSFKE